MAQSPPSFRFPFASLGKLPPEAQAAHRATFNALTDIYQAITLQKQASSTSTTTLNETVLGTSATGSATGVTSFNGETGAVTFFPTLGLVNNQSGVTSYVTQTQDNGALIVLNDASAIAISLNFGVTAPWFTTIVNQGSGTATLIPTQGTINGATNLSVAGGVFAGVYFDGTNWWAFEPSSGGGSGTVTSVGLTTPSWLTVAGSPVTGSGTLAVTATTGEPANEFLATPNGATGALGLRAIVPADLPVATSTTIGVVKPDNSTITISGSGVITATTGGGVSQIVAGTNITISPSGGTGVVTVNATTGSAPVVTTYSFPAGSLAPGVEATITLSPASLPGASATTPITANFVLNSTAGNSPFYIAMNVTFNPDTGGATLQVFNTSSSLTWTYTGVQILVAALV